MADETNAPAPTPQVEPEPQNALTEKFTEKEWTAVKEIRTALPLLLEEAFPDNPDARFRVVDLWGVKIDPGRVDDARVSVVLLKFVRATDFNAQKAMERLTATIKWREDYKIESLLTETFPDDVFGKVGYVYGRDKGGRPLTYNVYGGDVNLQAVFSDLDRFLRWRVQLMERAMRQLDFQTVDTLVQVHDYAGVSASSRTEQSKKAAAEATRLFSEYYPESLHVKFFVNVPSWLTWIYWLFKPIVPAKTFAKLKVVGTGPNTIGKELLPYVDPSELPTAYGGQAAGLTNAKP